MSHREMESKEDYQYKALNRFGGTVATWSDKGSLPILLVVLYTKHSSQKSYQESVRYTSMVLCAIGASVTLPLSPLHP